MRVRTIRMIALFPANFLMFGYKKTTLSVCEKHKKGRCSVVNERTGPLNISWV